MSSNLEKNDSINYALKESFPVFSSLAKKMEDNSKKDYDIFERTFEARNILESEIDLHSVNQPDLHDGSSILSPKSSMKNLPHLDLSE